MDHWFLKFTETLANPEKFPVLAGFKVKGDEKNCEKCGSCARACSAIKTRDNMVSLIFTLSY